MAIALLTLTLVGTLGLAATMVLGYLGPAAASCASTSWPRLASTFILVMGHSFIMFFLIATGVAMKEIEKERGWGDSFRRRTWQSKSRVFPLMTCALLLVIANFIVGAARTRGPCPALLHDGLAWATLLTCLVALHREYRVLGENNRLIEEAGLRREDTAQAARAGDRSHAEGRPLGPEKLTPRAYLRPGGAEGTALAYVVARSLFQRLADGGRWSSHDRRWLA